MRLGQEFRAGRALRCQAKGLRRWAEKAGFQPDRRLLILGRRNLEQDQLAAGPPPVSSHAMSG